MEKQKDVSEFSIHSDKLNKIFDEEFVNIGLTQGNLPQMLLGVSNQVLEKYYNAASELLEEKRWEDACDAFSFLTFLNPTVYGSWVGLGIAEQWLGKYDPALLAYIMAEAIDPENPTAFANACQCNIALERFNEGKRLYKIALDNCGDKQEHADLKEKIKSWNQYFK